MWCSPPAGPLAQQGGEDCTTAAVLSGPLPIIVSGTTVGYANDYDEVCPYAGSRAPDVVYSFTPATPITVDVLLCNGWTDFDTKLYIYDSCPPLPGRPVACNDDACTSVAGQGYVSALWNVPLRRRSAGDARRLCGLPAMGSPRVRGDARPAMRASARLGFDCRRWLAVLLVRLAEFQ